MILNKWNMVKLYVYRKGSGIVPGRVNAYGSVTKKLNLDSLPGMNIAFDIKRSEIKALDKPSQRCHESENELSVSKCVGDFIEKKVGNCSMGLLMNNKNLEKCNTMLPHQHLDFINSFNDMDEREIFDLTGCMPGCSKSHFDLVTLEKHRTNKTKLIVHLMYNRGEFDLTEEFYIYDYTSFIADVGGYLGLLLGYSLLSIYQAFMTWIQTCKRGVLDYLCCCRTSSLREENKDQKAQENEDS